MESVYHKIPIFENDRFKLRGTIKEDTMDLLRVYSDANAIPLFNSDNCHGDNFCYDTWEKMSKAIDFWLYSYETRQFVRWSVIDKGKDEAIGTIELFHRDAEDSFSNCGLLRLDLRSDYEQSDVIVSVLRLILPHTFELFHCDKVATKAISSAVERRKGLRELGFAESSKKLKGNDGRTEYDSYFVKLKVCQYNKLVRDRIPEIITASGQTCVTETLSDADYRTMLDAKLEEELTEYQESKSLEELADLLEVIRAVVRARGWTLEELEQVRARKATERGGFVQKILLREVVERA